jgi:hypothetical protein
LKRLPSIALYALEEDDAMPVLPWSVQEPESMVEEVARPIAEFCDPKVETE